MEAAAKEHIEEIRRTKFSIGGDHNPLIEDLHQAVKNLSAELYAKDVHFLMELIQVSRSLFCVCIYIYIYIYIYVSVFMCMIGGNIPISDACFLHLTSWWNPSTDKSHQLARGRNLREGGSIHSKQSVFSHVNGMGSP